MENINADKQRLLHIIHNKTCFGACSENGIVPRDLNPISEKDAIRVKTKCPFRNLCKDRSREIEEVRGYAIEMFIEEYGEAALFEAML